MRTNIRLIFAVLVLGAATTAHAFPWSKDMRRTPAIWPQAWPTGVPRMPADSTVPMSGHSDQKLNLDLASKLPNPTPRGPESEARGQATFERYCYPCHGIKAQGDGLVGKFVGAPNLTLPLTQGRADGYIYFYIRHGGILMPSYGYGVKSKDAWDVVNYLRKLQGK